MHDFVANKPDELPFVVNDRLLIMNYGDEATWYEAELNGQRGIVPHNYIQIDVPKWYMGRIPRSIAEQMLIGNKFEGAFLVRLSESFPGDFSLSIKCDESVQHFKIFRNEGGRFFLWSKHFYSINELVANYRTDSVSRDPKKSILLRDMHEDGQFVVEAIFDFNKQDGPEDESELEFKKGELITVFDSSDENWWGGCKGNSPAMHGYFPQSYVREFNPNIINHRS